MSKREVLAFVALVTGGLMSTTTATLPFAVLLLIGGGYLLALPYLDRGGVEVGPAGHGRRT
jgi:hypothetical protein